MEVFFKFFIYLSAFSLSSSFYQDNHGSPSSSNFNYNDHRGLVRSGGKRDCMSPRSKLGECAPIAQCPELSAMIKQSKMNHTIRNYLRSSVCEYIDNKPVVCCPLAITEATRETEPNNDYDHSIFLSPPKCGKSQLGNGGRIVGGKVAQLGAWPWEVALGYKPIIGGGAVTYHCGGALITNQYVLTAAHCTNHQIKKLSQVRMGVVDISSTERSNPPPVDIDIVKIIIYPGYNINQKYNTDIALVKLAKKVEFNSFIQPICLPTTIEMKQSNYENKVITVAGWGTLGFKKGTSEDLMEVELPILSNSVCENIFLKHGIRLTNMNVCAGNMKGGQDACQGDSGGPMMLKENDVTYIIGIVSFGYKCAEPGYPGVYTRVSSYLNWLADNIKT